MLWFDVGALLLLHAWVTSPVISTLYQLLLKPFLFLQVCCYPEREQAGGDGRDEK